MKHSHHQHAVLLDELTVLLCNFDVGLDYACRRYSSEADDNFRADELDLVAQPVNAHLLLLGLWIAVFGRAALYDICDIDILVSVKVDCNQHFIEELACSADKGLALKVLVFSGTLAYEHYLGVRSAHSDNNVGSCLAQLAFLAVCAGVF